MNLGIANRNPLNIRYVKANHWLGLHPQTPNVKGFCHFTAPAYGFRAAIILIKNYMRKYGCVTPENIIRRWAPPTETTPNFISPAFADAADWDDRNACTLKGRKSDVSLQP